MMLDQSIPASGIDNVLLPPPAFAMVESESTGGMWE
jgi:hypothetical protein